MSCLVLTPYVIPEKYIKSLETCSNFSELLQPDTTPQYWIYTAIQVNNTALLDYLLSKLGREKFEENMPTTLITKEIEIVKWFHTNNFHSAFNPSVMHYAAISDAYDVVVFLNENRTEGCFEGVTILDKLCSKGNLRMLDYLHHNYIRKERLTISENAFIACAMEHNYSLLKYLKDHFEDLYFDKVWIESAILNTVHNMQFGMFYVLYMTYTNDYRLKKGRTDTNEYDITTFKISRLLDWIEDFVNDPCEKAQMVEYINLHILNKE